MSTRCQIAVEGSKVLFYKHSDGYPSGVLDVLLPLVSAFWASRGYDADLPAHIAHAFIAANLKHYAEDSWYQKNPATVERSKFLGYGLDCEIHGDTEFLYTVKRDGSVTVEKTWSHTILGTFTTGTDPQTAIAVCDAILGGTA